MVVCRPPIYPAWTPLAVVMIACLCGTAFLAMDDAVGTAIFLILAAIIALAAYANARADRRLREVMSRSRKE